MTDEKKETVLVSFFFLPLILNLQSVNPEINRSKKRKTDILLRGEMWVDILNNEFLSYKTNN